MARICVAALCLCVAFAALAGLADAPLAQSADPSPAAKTAAKTTADHSEAGLTARIDAEINKVLARDGIKPAARSSDEQFLRRVYLDTVGSPPSYAEAKVFLDSTQPDKRDKLIDLLVADPRFSRHMANEWTVLLTPRSDQALSGGQLLADWMARRIHDGKGMHSIFREILTASGELTDNPAIVPYFANGEAELPTNLIGKFSKGMTGVQIQCAECHDHPYDPDFSQKDFQGMTAFVVAIRANVDNRIQPPRINVRDDASVPRRVLDAKKRYDTLDKQQQAQVDFYLPYVTPVTPDGVAVDTRDPNVWRNKLAAWIIDDANMQTRRYVANRIWAIAFGSGLVNPVDDFNPLNEASHPELLEALAGDLKANQWSPKRLYRAILKSETWQRGGNPAAKAERWHFAGYPVRQLTSEQFISTLVGFMSEKQLAELLKNSREAGLDRAIADLKAREQADRKAGNDYNTYDHNALARFAEQFRAMDGRWWITRWAAGRYARISGDDEMTSSEGFTQTIDQALAVMNGQFTNALAGSGEDSLLQRVVAAHPEADRIDALYLTILARKPSPEETRRLKTYFAESTDKLSAAEDLLFALLMTTELGTNH